jgi:hypothetical protein
MKQYSKVLIFQYGKVGSTSITFSTNNANYYKTIQKTYKEKFLSTHTHEVAKDILSKYQNILVINLVRLPIDRSISDFFQNIKYHCGDNYETLSMNELIQNFHRICSVKYTDDWMCNFFKIFNINIDNFKFDKINKFNKFTWNNNDILLFRFEDLEYVILNILPKYNIFVKKKKM